MLLRSVKDKDCDHLFTIAKKQGDTNMFGIDGLIVSL
jgi:hypothetical protein